MKKIIVLFLLITFFMLNLTFGVEKKDGLEERNIVPQTYTRDWDTPLKRLGASAVFIAASWVAPWETARDLASVVATGLLCDFTILISTNLLEYCAEKIGKCHVDAEIYTDKYKVKGSHKKNKSSLYKISEHSLGELVEACVHPKIRRARCVIPQVEHAMNFSLNVYMTYSLITGDKSQGFTFIGYGNLLGLGLLLAGASYNVNEIIYTYKTGLTRNDRPVAKIANAMCKAILAEFYFASHTTLALIRIPRLMTSWEWGFYRYLQTYGDYEAAAGIIQMGLNTVEYFSQSLKEEIKEIQKKSKRGIAKKKEDPSFLHNEKSLSKLKMSANEQENYYSQPEPAIISPKRESEEVSYSKKKKEKRRFIGPKLPQKDYHTEVPREEDNSRTIQDDERLIALERIMNLRREKNLKAKVIDEEIKALLKFLPNAKLEHLNHKLSSITLTFPNGETHQVKYEVAHTNIGIYQGDRKDRALDALLVCYLYGWNEGKIKYFMDKHGKKNFWNVPDFLVSVLWERGKV